MGVVVIIQLKLLGVVGERTLHRMALQSNARYTTNAVQTGGDTVQYSPTVSYEEVTTREETLTFSEQRFEKIGLASLPGWNGLRTYHQNVTKVHDSLEKTPHATIVRRKLTFTQRKPISLDATAIELDLKFVPSSVAYQADFRAEYRFRNPLKERAVIRFLFPLPGDSGTLSDFRISCDGETVSREFEQEVPGGQEVLVLVSYRNKGRRSWTYSPTQRRSQVDQLHLRVSSDNSDLKFRNDSLFPTEQKDQIWTWNLNRVITSQDISLFFPTGSKRERASRLLAYSPLGLILLGIGAAGFGTPKSALATTLSFSGGIVITSYLWTFLPFAMAVILGAGSGCVVIGSLSRSRTRIWCLLVGLTPLLFCWQSKVGLSLVGLGLASLLGLKIGTGCFRD